MQNNLYKSLKLQFNIAILTNRENIQNFFKKVVDNAGLAWYHNQAVTKRTDRKKAGRQKPEAK